LTSLLGGDSEFSPFTLPRQPEEERQQEDEKMLELVIMFGVIGWFSRTAKSKGKNGVLWGFIGAISYYGPVLIFGMLIFPEIVGDSLTQANMTEYMLTGLVLNLAIGIGCCFLARTILLSSDVESSSAA